MTNNISKVSYKPNSCNSAEHHCEDCHEETITEDHKEHACGNPTCEMSDLPHGHINPEHEHDNCFQCVKNHLRNIFPLEEKITKLKINDSLKQLLLNISYLLPAILVSKVSSKIVHPLLGEKVTPYVVSSFAVSSMYFANKGTSEKRKPLLISASSVGIIGLQQLTALPRWLMRPFMALAVDLINKNGNNNENKKSSFITKEDLFKHGRLQALVNIVPIGINFFLNKLEELNHSVSDPISRFFGNVGIMVTQVIGLSAGFLGFGFVFDKVFEKFDLSNNKEGSLAAKTESTVCACCGAPFCVAEAASEAGAMSATSASRAFPIAA